MRKKLSEVCEFYTGTGFQPGADSEGKEIFSGEIKRRAFKGNRSDSSRRTYKENVGDALEEVEKVC